jgi:hypothetical protein
MADWGPNKDPGYDAARATSDADWDRAEDALYDVLTVQPTTLAGVAALLAHVGQDQWLGFEDGDDPDGDSVLSVLAHNGGACAFARATKWNSRSISPRRSER